MGGCSAAGAPPWYLGRPRAAALAAAHRGIVARIKVNALIATLGTMGIFRGIAILLGGPGINFLPPSFTRLGQSVFLGMQAPIWLMLAVVAFYHFLMTRTRLFRQYYYIGSNQKAALLSGINVSGLQMLAFLQMGLLAGLSGIVFSARIGTSVRLLGCLSCETHAGNWAGPALRAQRHGVGRSGWRRLHCADSERSSSRTSGYCKASSGWCSCWPYRTHCSTVNVLDFGKLAFQLPGELL
jgi:hypothetical protein